MHAIGAHRPVSRPLPRPVRAAPAEPEAPSLVRVGHKREMRGAWVASVWNINFPSSPTATVAQQKAELVKMVDRLKECGFNAIFFQVRPEGDALYDSKLEPWSSALTGQQGQNPGYDPLQFLIEQAHQRNLEVHAWMNPYRAKAASPTQVAPHIGAEHPEVVHPYGAYKWMDPGSEVVRQKLVDVCTDVTKRYDVDGLHFDDYFYPYPDGKEFPDGATWGAYQAGGGTLSKGDWRRDNVNRAIQSVHEAVVGTKEHVRFGVSPFGMPAPERPEGTAGFDQYHEMYADPQKWMDKGWVDYLAPQLYWPTVAPKQPYETLLNWWADHAQGGRPIFAGNDLEALGTQPKWTVDEFRKEVAISRNRAGSEGNLWWHIGPLLENKQNIVDVFKNELYAEPALTPALPRLEGTTVAPPQVRLAGRRVELKHDEKLKAWTVYRPDGDGWKLDRVVPGSATQVELPAGRWAVAAAARSGVESQGVVVELSGP